MFSHASVILFTVGSGAPVQTHSLVGRSPALSPLPIPPGQVGRSPALSSCPVPPQQPMARWVGDLSYSLTR